MVKQDLEISESDLQNLAEMSAMVLSMFARVQADESDSRVQAWQKLCVSVLNSAHNVPSIRRHMELNPDTGYWFFKRPYIDNAFYSEMLEDYTDATFWSELVSRMAEQSLVENLGDEQASLLSDEERAARVSSLEKALWNEVNHYGMERLMFLLPPEES